MTDGCSGRSLGVRPRETERDRDKSCRLECRSQGLYRDLRHLITTGTVIWSWVGFPGVVCDDSYDFHTRPLYRTPGLTSDQDDG